jgi:transposase
MVMDIRGGKRFRTKQERRQIVEETQKPGASVSVVARAHEVNANQVFFWRRQYREGWLDEKKENSTALVPVKITSGSKALTGAQRESKAGAPSGIIEIDLGHARVRIEGAADADCVRAALQGLAR